MKKIKNIHYRRFLDNGIITLLKESHINKALENATNYKYRTGKNPRMAKALILLLYYTGARPNEVLLLKGENFTQDKRYLYVKLPASKNGLPRTAFLPFNKTYVHIISEYVSTVYEHAFCFYPFISRYIRKATNKKGTMRVRREISDGLRYWFKAWFCDIIENESISPYYLRHNRFSQLVQAGVDLQDVRMLKGSKTFESITPYIHMSAKSAQNIAKKLQ